MFILTSLKTYLKPEGKAFIVLAEWSDLEYFKELIAINDLIFSLVDTRARYEANEPTIYMKLKKFELGSTRVNVNF